jgi:hypothetical protein
MAVSAMASSNAANQQADAAARQSEAQARAQEYNAKVALQQAENATAVAGQQEETQRRKAREILGRSRAASAQTGLGLGGSNADLENQSEVFAELDSLNIRYEGELKGRGYLAQSTLDKYGAETSIMNAGNTRAAGRTAAAASLLAGASSMYNKAFGSSASVKPTVS